MLPGPGRGRRATLQPWAPACHPQGAPLPPCPGDFASFSSASEALCLREVWLCWRPRGVLYCDMVSLPRSRPCVTPVVFQEFYSSYVWLGPLELIYCTGCEVEASFACGRLGMPLCQHPTSFPLGTVSAPSSVRVKLLLVPLLLVCTSVCLHGTATQS